MTTVRSISGDQKVRGSERCYQILRKMLTCAQIPPGTRLREVEWSERIGVQRAALREAMVLLVHDGLLRRRSSGGFFTPTFSEIDIDAIIDARVVLEIGALKLTCKRKLPAASFRPVEEICDMMLKCHEAGMSNGFCEADFLFHQKLLELSGNTSLIQMFSHSAQMIFVLAPITEETRKAAEISTIQEHRQLLELVQTERLNDAIEMLESHLLMAKRNLKASFE